MTKVYDTATDLITFARLQAQNTTSGSSYLGSDGLLKFAAEDEPRIEYGSDGSLKGLLIEEQRTNLVTYSEDFTHSSWENVASLTPNIAPAPDGTATATRLDVDYLEIRPSVTSGTTYTYSIFIKSNGNTEPYIIATGTSFPNTRAYFDLSNSSVTSSTTEGAAISPVGAGWYRISITETATATDSTSRLRLYGASAFIYGAQLEEGSFATSYIPTSGSQSTRSPDIASIPVSAFGYNQSAGTVVVEASPISNTNCTAVALASSADNPGQNERWQIRSQSTNTVRVLTGITGNNPLSTLGSLLDVTGITIPGTYRAAHTLEENYSQVAVNGSLSTADTSVGFPDVDEIRIGALSAGGTLETLNGHIKSLTYYPRRLTDAQLQELTA